MVSKFSTNVNSIIKKIDKSLPAMPVEIEFNKKPEIIKESVKPVKKAEKLVLVTQHLPFEDKTPITVESLQKVGFKSAPKEDFIGASDKTLFCEVNNPTGRSTIVYDFSPLGNQGKPALHLYYSANDTPISESLVCFSAESNIGQILEITDIMQKIAPKETKSLHNLNSVNEIIEQAKSSINKDK